MRTRAWRPSWSTVSTVKITSWPLRSFGQKRSESAGFCSGGVSSVTNRTRVQCRSLTAWVRSGSATMIFQRWYSRATGSVASRILRSVILMTTVWWPSGNR